MKTKHQQLKENIQKIITVNPNLPINAVVKSIEGDTCTIIMENGFEIDSVRLKPIANGSETVLMIPAVGSYVMVLSLDGSFDSLTVLKYDRLQKVLYKENGLEFEIDSVTRKFKIQVGGVSLKDVFQQLTDLLLNLKVYTAMGPSGTPIEESIHKIEKFETDFKKLLK